MTTGEKQQAATTARDFINSLGAVLSVSFDDMDEFVAKFPEYPGLGTDGTCWTDSEFADYFAGIMKRGLALLRKAKGKS